MGNICNIFRDTRSIDNIFVSQDIPIATPLFEIDSSNNNFINGYVNGYVNRYNEKVEYTTQKPVESPLYQHLQETNIIIQ